MFLARLQAGNYAFGAQDFFNGGKVGWEFDFVGQGSVAGGVLSGTGLISDPFGAFGGTATDSNVTFKGTAAPNAVNVGRYMMATNPLAITVTGGTPQDFKSSGEELFWMNADTSSLSLGFLLQMPPTPLFPAEGTKP